MTDHKARSYLKGQPLQEWLPFFKLFQSRPKLSFTNMHGPEISAIHEKPKRQWEHRSTISPF